MSPFPSRRAVPPVEQAVAHSPLLSKLAAGFAQFPALAASKDAALLQRQLRAAEAEIRTLERGPRTLAARRRLIDLNRAADKLALDLYKLRIQADPESVYTLDFPFYQNWGHGGMRWIFGALHGRVGRDVYGLGLVLGLLGSGMVALAAQPLGGALAAARFAPASLLWMLAGFLLIWAYIAVTVKRYHDMDRSGLWAWVALVPVVGLVWQVAECALWPGTRGPNRFE